MNKTELVQSVADTAGLSKADAQKALEAVLDSITNALSAGDSVSLIGFGSFAVAERAERMGRNPSTGKEMLIAASKKPTFKAGKALKDALA